MKTKLLTLALGLLLFASCKKDDPPVPEIKPEKPTVELPSGDVGSFTASFTATAPWTISLSDTRAVPTWFTLDKISGDAGSHTLTINITEANPSDKEARLAYIKIVSGEVVVTITISQPAVPVPVTGVTLDKTTATLSLFKSGTLVATITPENATNKGVTWSSSDETVLKVSSSGVLTGVTAGTATITVTTTDGAKTATCTVTVVHYVEAGGVTVDSWGNAIEIPGGEAID